MSREDAEILDTQISRVSPVGPHPHRKRALPGKAVGGAGVGTAMGTPTLPLPLFSRLLLRLLLGWLPPLLPLLEAGQQNTSEHKHTRQTQKDASRFKLTVSR